MESFHACLHAQCTTSLVWTKPLCCATMTRAGDCMVLSCRALRNTPAAVICVALSVLQMASLDYYLVSMLSIKQLGWIAADAINLGFLMFVIVQVIHCQLEVTQTNNEFYTLPIAYLRICMCVCLVQATMVWYIMTKISH